MVILYKSQLIYDHVFQMSDRLYFQEEVANLFGIAFGYFEKGPGKKHIGEYFNEKTIGIQVVSKNLCTMVCVLRSQCFLC
jgi:hypothetical protein